MKVRFSVLICMAFVFCFVLSACGSKDNNKKGSVSVPGITVGGENNKNSDNSEVKNNTSEPKGNSKSPTVKAPENSEPVMYQEKKAVDIIADKYYKSSKKYLYLDISHIYKTNVYVINYQKYAGKNKILKTYQAYLLKNGKVIATQYDKNNKLNKKFNDLVKSYIVQ